jgi:hypothetical protein
LIAVYLHAVPIGVGALSGGVERSGHKSGNGCAAQKYGTHAKLLSVFWRFIRKNGNSLNLFPKIQSYLVAFAPYTGPVGKHVEKLERDPDEGTWIAAGHRGRTRRYHRLPRRR